MEIKATHPSGHEEVIYIPERSLEESVLALIRISKKIADVKAFGDAFQSDIIVSQAIKKTYDRMSDERMYILQEIKNHASAQPVTEKIEGGEEGRGDRDSPGAGEKGSSDNAGPVLQKGADENPRVRRPPSKEMEARNSDKNDSDDDKRSAG